MLSSIQKGSIAKESTDFSLHQAVSDAPISRLQAFLDEFLKKQFAIRLLEAGCGSASQLSFPDKQVHMTGIDISLKQLNRNHSLDVKIQADIQYYTYQPSSYDVIVCQWVLEHLSKPDLALHGFALAVDKGGLIVLAVPNVLSVKGLITKYTPFFVHVWIYRHLHNRQIHSQQDDIGPFRTYLRYSIRPNAIRQFAEDNALQVVYFASSDLLDAPWAFTGGKLASVARATYKALKNIVKIITFGLLDDSEFYMVLQRIN